ncbi:MAG: hypothetical protein ACOX62_11895 [Christensenellales bacterium]
MSRRLFLISMVSVLILQCFVFSNVIATPEKKLEIIYQYSNDNNKAGFEALISKFEELYPMLR